MFVYFSLVVIVLAAVDCPELAAIYGKGSFAQQVQLIQKAYIEFKKLLQCITVILSEVAMVW